MATYLYARAICIGNRTVGDPFPWVPKPESLKPNIYKLQMEEKNSYTVYKFNYLTNLFFGLKLVCVIFSQIFYFNVPRLVLC
jgi:hypothetical protein